MAVKVENNLANYQTLGSMLLIIIMTVDIAEVETGK